ncbi:hypothetical protein [Streptomyces glaucosporus]|uniref:hypothetical protein n=1 Tax=Streptomyces glaucosporus TaxID=284044 RepID=UPI0031DAB5B3
MHPGVARLAAAVPPPAGVRPRDRRRVESMLGTPLPADCKQLVDLCGGGVFDDTVRLLEPGCANRHYDLLTRNANCPGELESLREAGEPRPAEPDEPGSRLVSWAVTGNGEYLVWLARPGRRPDDWTVMVDEGRGPEWESHPLSCTGFLNAVLLTGDAESEAFYGMPFEQHGFRPSADFL